ncbi:MAG: SDR family NAD(P)-dependent oxidoreductase [Bacteroidota bacterium]
MEKFQDKNVLITGASAGLGKALAINFAKHGANIFIGDLSDPLDSVSSIKEAGGKVGYSQVNISQEQEVKSLVSEAATFFGGKIDILINNAGFNGKANLVKDMQLKDWNYTLGVNLTGTMLVCREVIPYMMKHHAGNILNVASNVGKRGLPFRADYVCSKWALLGFTQTLALELVDHNIRVNAVCPGPIEGERIEQLVKMHAEAEGVPFDDMHKAWESVPMKRFIKPQEVFGVIKFLCSEDSSAMTGQALNATGGFLMN